MSIFHKTIKVLFIFFLLVAIFSFFKKGKLPSSGQIQNKIKQEPIQEKTEKKEFVIKYLDKDYKIIPLAEYELWGIVATHNDIRKWYNFYHDKNSVNIKDFCVIWGKLAESGFYNLFNFRSGEWTCYVDFNRNVFRGEDAAKNLKAYEEWRKYSAQGYSNNHLLGDTEEIRQEINKTRIGDQIYFKGMLVKYGKSDLPEKHFRESSMIREDSDCEVVYVTEYKILKRATPFYYLLYNISRIILIILLVLEVLLIFLEAFQYTKKQKNI